LEGDRFVALCAEDQNWDLVNASCVRHAAINADWLKDYVFYKLSALVGMLNGSSEIAEITEWYPHIHCDTFTDKLRDGAFKLVPNAWAAINGKYAHLIKGPMKSHVSAMRKARDYRKEHALNRGQYASPDALSLKDQLRFTISVADPMVAAMCVYGMLDFDHIRVVGIKNKYLGDADTMINAGSPSILVNLLVELVPLPPLVFEVQVYLDVFYNLKEAEHKIYELRRANKASELLRPIFDHTVLSLTVEDHSQLVLTSLTEEEKSPEVADDQGQTLEVLRPMVPDVVVVTSPLTDGPIPETYLEVHGTSLNPEVANVQGRIARSQRADIATSSPMEGPMPETHVEVPDAVAGATAAVVHVAADVQERAAVAANTGISSAMEWPLPETCLGISYDVADTGISSAMNGPLLEKCPEISDTMADTIARVVHGAAPGMEVADVQERGARSRNTHTGTGSSMDRPMPKTTNHAMTAPVVHGAVLELEVADVQEGGALTRQDTGSFSWVEGGGSSPDRSNDVSTARLLVHNAVPDGTASTPSPLSPTPPTLAKFSRMKSHNEPRGTSGMHSVDLPEIRGPKAIGKSFHRHAKKHATRQIRHKADKADTSCSSLGVLGRGLHE
jgi:hypothetical protein